MATVLSIMVLAALALLGGGIYLWNRSGMRRQAVLMLVLVAVIAVNIAILVVPNAQGIAPAGQAPK